MAYGEKQLLWGNRSVSTCIRNALLILGLIIILCSGSARATMATGQEAEQVCRNWLSQIVYEKGNWAASPSPAVEDVFDIAYNGLLLARCYNIAPRGFIIVPVLKEMQPIKAYSDESSLDASQENGFLLMIREILYERLQIYEDISGTASDPKSGDENPISFQSQRALWDIYTQPTEIFNAGLSSKRLLEEAGPLTVSSWHQRAPYNNYCPHDGIDVCVVGCTATAMAQLLKFWQWPVNGNGSHSYTWYNTRCGNSGPPVVLSADFSDEYDWSNIVDSCDLGCTPEQEAALAELSYEVGVSINMNYGSCGSAAGYSTFALINHFRYSPQLYRTDRVDHDLDSWFSIIRDEIDAGRPLLYGINMHSIVCDGYRDHGSGQYEYHMNYGWGNEFSAWYRLDSLYCGWIPGQICPYDQDGLMAQIEPQSTPFLSMVSYSIDDTAGDDNGHADAGEPISLMFTVDNIGMEATNISASLASGDPNINITAGTTTFSGPIPWDGQGACQTPFELTVDPGCADPHIALLEIAVSADGGYTASDSIQLFIGETTGFADDMEGGEGYWRHTVLTPGFSEQWHLESFRRHGGSYSWKAGKSGSLDYSSYQDACLMTQPFLIPENAQLKFWHWMEAEVGDPGTAWDGGIVMMSLQDGQWFQIFPEGGYQYTIIDNAANPLEGGTPCFSGNIDWTEEVFDLSAYSGVAQIMFRFAVDGAVTEEGWYIDDVAIERAYICGDANSDEAVNVGDAVFLVNLIFHDGLPPNPEAAGDVNCDGNVNVGDAVFLANYVFQSEAPAPCSGCP